MSFPVEAVPDGAVFAPHHYIYGMILALVMVFVVWDNFSDREPLLTALALGMGLFGFLFVWEWYPVAGALMSLVGPVFAVLFVLMGWAGLSVGDVWSEYPIRYRVATVVFSVFALDDAIEHAFDVWTPFDWIWNEFLYYRIGVVTVIALAIGFGVLVIYAVYDETKDS